MSFVDSVATNPSPSVPARSVAEVAAMPPQHGGLFDDSVFKCASALVP